MPRSHPFRLVATDLDGTLVGSDGTISERSCAALAAVERAGATLVMVTGRPPRWMVPVVEQTGHRGVAVCANGALVLDLHTAEPLVSHPLDQAAIQELTGRLRAALRDVTFAVEYGYDYGHEPTYRPRWPCPPDTRVADITVLLDRPVLKLLVRSERHDADGLLAQALAAGEGIGLTLTHSSTEGLLEVSAAGVDKASTLARLAASYGVAPAEVLAFGDMPNDVPLLTWAGHGVAVANAHPAVLSVADEVTASNDEDGVAVVLERYFPAGAVGRGLIAQPPT